MAATVTNRALTQYSGDTPANLFIRDVPDWSPHLRRTDYPLFTTIKKSAAPKNPMLKYEFGWGSVDPDNDALTGAINNAVTTIPVVNGSVFQVGDTLYIDQEAMLVTAIAGNNLTVDTRPFGGVAASHLSGATVFKLAPAIKENQSTPLSPIAQGELDYNYYSQMEYSIQLSHRARVTATYETRSLMGTRDEQEMKKKMSHTAPNLMEQQLLFGYRNLGSTSSPSSFGGLLNTSTFTTTSNTTLTGPLTENTLMSNLQTVYQLVGNSLSGKTIMAHPFVLRAISSWYNDARRVAGNETSISTSFTKIDSGWFGEFTLMPHYKMVKSSATGPVPLDRLWVGNLDDFAIVPYAGDSGWSMAPLPEDGWFTKVALRGDFTLKAQNPDSRLILGGFSTTDADYVGIA